jgi:AcrR family transcriptional regulator
MARAAAGPTFDQEPAIDSSTQPGREKTQRERLFDAMVEVTNSDGYAGASASAVITAADVSSASFDEHFSSAEDCFRATIEDIQQQLATLVDSSIEQRPANEAVGAAVEALVAFASAESARARFVMSEALGGDSQAHDARDRGIALIAESIERALAQAPAEAIAPDVEHRVLIGGIYRLIGTRLRRSEPAISRLTDVLERWLGSYARRIDEHRWRALQPAPRSGSSPHVPEEPIQRMPNVIPPGRPRISDEEIADMQRLRILYAAAKTAERKGYIATTVADIAELADVDEDAFHALFSDKQDAFLAAHELGFTQVMDLTSKAYFSAETWPMRSWEAGRALTQLLEDNPLVAHVGFVEAYAVGPAAVQRIEGSHIAFMFFLQEGLVYRKQRNPPTGLAMEVIVTSIFEIIYLQARHDNKPRVAAMLPHIAHLWLTPFLGSRESDEFIDARLAEAAS